VIYKIGYGKPPPGPRRKNLSALLIAALNEPAYITIDGKRRKITKREAIVTQMVNKSPWPICAPPKCCST
jgi:hypothetical protein